MIQMKRRSLLKLNTKLFIDLHFLREGAFTNVASGQQFYDGSSLSRLVPDDAAHETLYGVSVGQVWQSPYRNWVYESGVPLDGTGINVPPRMFSGVYVQGAFRAQDDSAFGHTPDFINGRIIFNQPQSLDLDVHADFSWRHVRVEFEHAFNQQFNEGYLDSKFVSNPLTSMQIVYPSGTMQPFPAVFIEVDERDHKGFELGNRSAHTTDTIKMHIWALDDLQRDDIIDTIDQQIFKVLPIIDFNKMPLPLSGIYNTLSPEYVPYQRLWENREVVSTVGSGLPIKYYARIDSSEPMNETAMESYERGLVKWQVSVQLNAPNTPLVFDP
jgi:hypothetical protein